MNTELKEALIKMFNNLLECIDDTFEFDPDLPLEDILPATSYDTIEFKNDKYCAKLELSVK